MPEAVIVDAIRTPIGRAAKGSLKDVRTHEPETFDAMMGCGRRDGPPTIVGRLR